MCSTIKVKCIHYIIRLVHWPVSCKMNVLTPCCGPCNNYCFRINFPDFANDYIVICQYCVPVNIIGFICNFIDNMLSILVLNCNLCPEINSKTWIWSLTVKPCIWITRSEHVPIINHIDPKCFTPVNNVRNNCCTVTIWSITSFTNIHRSPENSNAPIFHQIFNWFKCVAVCEPMNSMRAHTIQLKTFSMFIYKLNAVQFQLSMFINKTTTIKRFNVFDQGVAVKSESEETASNQKQKFQQSPFCGLKKIAWYQWISL